jgi:hypothetical protein
MVASLERPANKKPRVKFRGFFIFVIFGGAKEDRTPDLCNAIAALSQLSYGPLRRRI